MTQPLMCCNRNLCIVPRCPWHPVHFDAAPDVPRLDLCGSSRCAMYHPEEFEYDQNSR